MQAFRDSIAKPPGAWHCSLHAVSLHAVSLYTSHLTNQGELYISPVTTWCAGCAASLTRLAQESANSSTDSTFSQYAAAVLNSLVYLLKDSLERLQDIHNIELSMADEAAWKALPPR